MSDLSVAACGKNTGIFAIEIRLSSTGYISHNYLNYESYQARQFIDCAAIARDSNGFLLVVWKRACA